MISTRIEVISTGSNTFENMWYMEIGGKTKYVLGFSGATPIGLEHGEKKSNDYDHQPAEERSSRGGVWGVTDKISFAKEVSQL